jgi:hypothetical protein
MSRSAEEWKEIHARAVKIRSLHREMEDLLDDWPVSFTDTGESARRNLESGIRFNLKHINTLIGSCYCDWAWEDE